MQSFKEIDSFPAELPLKEEFQVYQAYLSIDPEVRIRRNAVGSQDTAYFIALKSGTGMVRHEVEIPISKEHFYALAEMVAHPFITKDFRIYHLPGGLELECSHVDKGTPRLSFPPSRRQRALNRFPSLRRTLHITPTIR